MKGIENDLRIALAGNPNVGKSTLFNALTGMRQHTGNWPGKTVSVAEGVCRWKNTRITWVDLPGTYSLSARSPEEEITGEYIRSHPEDIAVVVCDATALERSLPFLFQVMAETKHVICCVNLMDEARSRGMDVDIGKIEEILGVPAIGVTARKKSSLSLLLQMVTDPIPVCHNGLPLPRTTEEISAASREIARSAITKLRPDPDARDRRIDRILTSRLFGYPVMLLLLCGVFWLTIQGANRPSEWLSAALFSLGEKMDGILHGIGCPVFIKQMLLDGVWRMLAWVVAVMLPPMAVFFPLFTLLEDLGYLPRVAFNLDRPFCRCGSCGKQALTMAMGFGCNAAGVTGCRIIDSPRERMIGILTNSFVPCNGRFPLLITLSALFFPFGTIGTAAVVTLLVLTAVFMTLCATKLLSTTFLKGKQSSFILEMPPYRIPRIGQVLVRSMLDRTVFVLGRAAAVAAPAGAVLWLAAHAQIGSASLLRIVSDFLSPLGKALGMDGVILTAFILAFPANETVLPIAMMIYLSRSTLSGVTSPGEIGGVLLANGWTWSTAVSVMLFSLFHWPCSTTLWTVRRETMSWKWTAAAAALPTVFGIIACGFFHGAVSLFMMI